MRARCCLHRESRPSADDWPAQATGQWEGSVDLLRARAQRPAGATVCLRLCPFLACLSSSSCAVLTRVIESRSVDVIHFVVGDYDAPPLAVNDLGPEEPGRWEATLITCMTQRQRTP